MFLLRKLISTLVMPPAGPLLLVVLGLALARRARRTGLALAWAGALCLLALSTPLVADALHGLLGEWPPLDPGEARGARAIVVLAGGWREAPEEGGRAPGAFSLERALYAARIARSLGLPLLAAGGSVFGGTPEAQLMRETIERDLRTPVRWTESASRDTHENALYSAQILRASGIERVVLVTHAFHMRRARREFAAAGISTVPAPVGASGGRSARTLAEQLPNMDALRSSGIALHELAGDLLARLR
ncbi:MAG: YdcF family protein [Rhodocyclaceae bacterium]